MTAYTAVSSPRILLQCPVATSTVSPARLIYCRHKKPHRHQVFYLTLKQSEKRCSLTRARGNTIGGANKRRVGDHLFTQVHVGCGETGNAHVKLHRGHGLVNCGSVRLQRGVSARPPVTTTGMSPLQGRHQRHTFSWNNRPGRLHFTDPITCFITSSNSSVYGHVQFGELHTATCLLGFNRF